MEYENTAGSLKISSEVVASIAEYAVKEVEGVACLAPIVSNIGGWLLEKQTIKPISIQMNEGKATIDIRLLVEPNAKIPVLSRKLQEAVKDAVQSMTGIEVATVNLYIAGVSVPRTANTAEEELDSTALLIAYILRGLSY